MSDKLYEMGINEFLHSAKIALLEKQKFIRFQNDYAYATTGYVMIKYKVKKNTNCNCIYDVKISKNLINFLKSGIDKRYNNTLSLIKENEEYFLEISEKFIKTKVEVDSIKYNSIKYNFEKFVFEINEEVKVIPTDYIYTNLEMLNAIKINKEDYIKIINIDINYYVLELYNNGNKYNNFNAIIGKGIL